MNHTFLRDMNRILYVVLQILTQTWTIKKCNLINFAQNLQNLNNYMVIQRIALSNIKFHQSEEEISMAPKKKLGTKKKIKNSK